MVEARVGQAEGEDVGVGVVGVYLGPDLGGEVEKMGVLGRRFGHVRYVRKKRREIRMEGGASLCRLNFWQVVEI